MDRPAPTLTDSQLARLRQLLSQTRSDEARFCAWLGVAALEDVLQNDFVNYRFNGFLQQDTNDLARECWQPRLYRGRA